MDIIPKMIQEMEDNYHRLLKDIEEIYDVYSRLWKVCNVSENLDEEGMLKQLTSKIILANMTVKEDADTVEEYGMRIRKTLWEYEKNKENIYAYYSDNDKKLIEDMVDQINACKDKMCPVKIMILYIEEAYHMYYKNALGPVYIFGNLWEAYAIEYCSNQEDTIKMLVYNIIIANMNLQEEALTSSQKFCIGETIISYEKHKEKIYMYYDDNDIKLIEGMVDQINACKEKWAK